MLCRRPDEKNWAPKEVVCHLRDVEEFFILRFQTLAAAHEPPLVPADPERWAEERQYIRNDAAEAARAFRRRREECLRLRVDGDMRDLTAHRSALHRRTGSALPASGPSGPRSAIGGCSSRASRDSAP